MSYLETRSNCTLKCKSTQHANELNSLITKIDDPQLLLSGIQKCWNCQKIQDSNGRMLLHMAACCGRIEAIEWLVKHKKADLQVKTVENGWTSLHCAAFYGQIGAFIALIKNGANLSVFDNDKYTPIEHLAIDKIDFYKDINLLALGKLFSQYFSSNIKFNCLLFRLLRLLFMGYKY